MKGSALEFVARYQPYDPQRLLSGISRTLSSDGFQIAPGIQGEADGVLRLQTPFRNGPHAGLTLLFPRPQNIQPAWRDPFDTQDPRRLQTGLEDGAPGVMVEAGLKLTNAENTSRTVALQAGALPGSYLNLQQTQGQTTLAGVPLPREIRRPTTAVAGLSYRSHGENQRLDLTAGGYVNPAALAPEALSEPSAYGLYAGMYYRNGRWQTGLSASTSLDAPKPDFSVMATFGTRF